MRKRVFLKQMIVAALIGGAGIASTLVANPAAAQGAQELVMFETDNCVWCEKWVRDVGPVYGSSPEGRQLPLRRVNIDRGTPPDLATIYPPQQSPTFVILKHGREYGRIAGYPGPRRFWDMLRVGLRRLER